MVKSKILYIADTAPPKKDGVITFMLETSRRLSEKFGVCFLLPKIEGAEKAARALKLNATFVPVRRFKIADYPPAVPKSKIIRQVIEEADLIFINSIGPLGSRSLKYARKIGKPIVEFVHSIDWEIFAYATRFPDRYAGMLRPIVRRLYNKSDLLLVANKKIRVILRGAKVRSRIKILHLGIDMKRFHQDRIKRVYMRRELGLKDNFVIGFHGRLSKEKNIKVLVKAFEQVQKRIPAAKLLIIGDGPKRKLLKKNQDIISVGFVDNPEDYLQAVDVYVLASQTETSALSLMEAMACSLPCIATNVGAIPSYLKHNINGILIDKDELDANLLAHAIEKLHRNILLRNKLRENAKQITSELPSWDKTARELEQIFEEVLKHNS